MKIKPLIIFLLFLLLVYFGYKGYYYYQFNNIVTNNERELTQEELQFLNDLLRENRFSARQQEQVLDRVLGHIQKDSGPYVQFIIQNILNKREIREEKIIETFRRLLPPKIITRKAYRTDLPIAICLLHDTPLIHLEGYEIDFHQMVTPGEGGGTAGASHLRGGKSIYFAFGKDTRLASGIYSATAEYQYTVRSKSDKKVLVEIAETIPLEINVVDPTNADPIALHSTPELDAEIKSLLKPDPNSTASSGGWETPSGRKVSFHTRFALRYERMPENLAFRAIFRDQNGNEYPIPTNYGWVWRRDKSEWGGGIIVTPGGIALEEIGTYSGTLILIPDTDVAFCDPTFQQIWGGRLEYPYTFIMAGSE